MKASALIKDLQTEDGPRGARGGQGGDGGEGGTLKGTRANRRWQISGGERSKHEEEMLTAARMKTRKIKSRVGGSGRLTEEGQSERSVVSVAAHYVQISMR